MHGPITQSLQARTETEFAYLAGIIDGEGSIGIYRSSVKTKLNRVRSFYPTVIIVQRDKILPQWLHDNFGCSLAHYVYREKGFKSGKRTYWRWFITGKKTGELLIRVLPYLILKREQAECAIALADTILGGGKQWIYPDGTKINKTGLPGRPGAKPLDLFQFQESLYYRCKQLNAHPIPEG